MGYWVLIFGIKFWGWGLENLGLGSESFGGLFFGRGLAAQLALVIDCVHCRVFVPAARKIWVFGCFVVVGALALDDFVRGRPRLLLLKKLIRRGPKAKLHRCAAEIFIQIFVPVSAILLIILSMAGPTPAAIVALLQHKKPVSIIGRVFSTSNNSGRAHPTGFFR